jgi:POT family proton-dependent oligopeptide transporter
MGVNVGAFIAPLACGYFGETGNPDDFKWGFLLAAVVILLTIVIFETQKSKYLLSPDGKQLGVLPDARQQALSAEQAKSASALPMVVS